MFSALCKYFLCPLAHVVSGYQIGQHRSFSVMGSRLAICSPVLMLVSLLVSIEQWSSKSASAGNLLEQWICGTLIDPLSQTLWGWGSAVCFSRPSRRLSCMLKFEHCCYGSKGFCLGWGIPRKQRDSISIVLSTRAFCDNGNILYLHYLG